jgi:hypothetical protein
MIYLLKVKLLIVNVFTLAMKKEHFEYSWVVMFVRIMELEDDLQFNSYKLVMSNSIKDVTILRFLYVILSVKYVK